MGKQNQNILRKNIKISILNKYWGQAKSDYPEKNIVVFKNRIKDKKIVRWRNLLLMFIFNTWNLVLFLEKKENEIEIEQFCAAPQYSQWFNPISSFAKIRPAWGEKGDTFRVFCKTIKCSPTSSMNKAMHYTLWIDL